MQSCYFYRNGKISWSLFADKYTGFSESQSTLFDISIVLGEACRVFAKVFGEDMINAHPVLSVLHCDDGPITYRENTLIFLSSRGRYYNNHIYQFAHELCHFMVTGNTVNEYRWLDETLAQMMSWYTINAIYESRYERNLKQLSTLYETMLSYINDDMRDLDDLHGESIAEYIQRNLAYLRKNWVDRRKNRTIACEIYPLFCEHDVLWKIVPFLDQLRPDMTLIGALRTLCDLASIPTETGNLLTQRLCQQPLVPPQ